MKPSPKVRPGHPDVKASQLRLLSFYEKSAAQRTGRRRAFGEGLSTFARLESCPYLTLCRVVRPLAVKQQPGRKHDNIRIDKYAPIVASTHGGLVYLTVQGVKPVHKNNEKFWAVVEKMPNGFILSTRAQRGDKPQVHLHRVPCRHIWQLGPDRTTGYVRVSARASWRCSNTRSGCTLTGWAPMWAGQGSTCAPAVQVPFMMRWRSQRIRRRLLVLRDRRGRAR